MNKTITKGFHRPIFQIPAFLSAMGRTGESFVMERKVTFTESCRHDLGDEHQKSWSKLFGFCFGLSGIHRKSYRFGWRYNVDTGMIEICRIVYDNGRHIMEQLCEAEIGEEHTCRLEYTVKDGNIALRWFVNCMRDAVEGKYIAPKSLRFGCGLYFGGKRPAPKTMTIKIRNHGNQG